MAEAQARPQPEKTPVGIRTPLRLGQGSSGLFEVHSDLGKTIKDNLRNLLLTHRGERLMFTDLGADLRSLLTELQDDGDVTALTQIGNTVARYMPFIRLETMIPKVKHSDNERSAKVSIIIAYSVPSLGLSDQAVQVELNFMG